MSDDLLVGLRKKFKVWSTETTKEATKNLGKFKKLIKVSSRTEERGGQLSIKTTGEAKKKKSPVARAYEYGSGKWSRSKKKSPRQVGTGGKIKIEPKKKKFLAFYWEKAIRSPRKSFFVSNKKIYRGGEDEIPADARILLASVLHSGVQAANNGKGYIAPAFAKTHRKIRKELGPEVNKAVVGTFRKAFVSAKK